MPGVWNMAVDEWLLRSAAEDGILSLRFYEWAEPTLSLGYFQRHTDRAQHAASADCPLVRRASGGGALVHDRELTYSLAVPAAHRLARQAEELYFAVHESLVALLGRLAPSSEGQFLLCTSTDHHGPNEPFLCFERRSRGDLLCAESNRGAETKSGKPHKLCGSAQRRYRGAVLQHGGVLLARSPQAPELPGLQETSGLALPASELREAWLGALLQDLGLDAAGGASSGATAKAEIDQLSAKFEGKSWIERR